MRNITARNLIYSSLALALASSYFYVQGKTFPLAHEPRTDSDEQQAQGLEEIQTETFVESVSARVAGRESETFAD
jgi:hypothetical protein